MREEVIWEDARSLVDSQIDANQLHIWPFSRSFPVDVRFVVLDRREEVPAHQPDHLEVVVVESGRAGYEVNGHTTEIKQNDVLLVGERIRHRTLPTPAYDGGARVAVLSFLPQLLLSGNPAGDDLQYLMPFSVVGPSPAHVPNVISGIPGFSREIFDFIERVLKAMPGDSERSRLAVRTYLRMILFTLADYYWDLRATHAQTRRLQDQLARIRPALDHVQLHFSKPMHVQQAARLCAMSQTCFMELFKEVTGQPFAGYLKRFRIGKAQELLLTTDKSLAEIGYRTGFCDQSHFGAVFRDVTGMTPLAYRKSKSWVDLSPGPPAAATI